MADISKLNFGNGDNNIKDAKAFRTDDAAETALANDDTFPFYDASASTKKKSTWSNIVAKIKAALGTAAVKDVPTSGNASSTQVVMGNDTRLSDSRPASDVSSWAKASSKPSYTASEVNAAPKSHASTATTYGVGTTTSYGHNKVIDNLTKTSYTNGESLSAHMGNALAASAAPVQATTTAIKAYDRGEYFYMDNILYKTTASISNGGTITVNGNCVVANTLGTEIRTAIAGMLTVASIGMTSTAISGSSYKECRFNCAKTGWIPLGINRLCQDGSGSGWYYLSIESWNMDTANNQVIITVYNRRSSTSYLKGSIGILYWKDPNSL